MDENLDNMPSAAPQNFSVKLTLCDVSKHKGDILAWSTAEGTCLFLYLALYVSALFDSQAISVQLRSVPSVVTGKPTKSRIHA